MQVLPSVPLAQQPVLAPLFGPPALVPTESLTDQAARLADHVLAAAPRLPPRYVARKALDAVAFSLGHGLRDLSLPTKLVGVAEHQQTLAALADRLPVSAHPRLVVSVDLEAYAVDSDGVLHPVGRIQPKHAPWLAPLVARGAAVHLLGVSGTPRRARGLPVTLGLNVRVSAMAHALRRPALVAEVSPLYRIAQPRVAA